jgi:hypothetical protein
MIDILNKIAFMNKIFNLIFLLILLTACNSPKYITKEKKMIPNTKKAIFLIAKRELKS